MASPSIRPIICLDSPMMSIPVRFSLPAIPIKYSFPSVPNECSKSVISGPNQRRNLSQLVRFCGWRSPLAVLITSVGAFGMKKAQLSKNSLDFRMIILVELHSTVDFKGLTGDVVRIRTSQEGNGIGNVLWFGEPL